MIKITTSSRTDVHLNPPNIVSVWWMDATEETIVSMCNGQRWETKELLEDVLQKITPYTQQSRTESTCNHS